MKRVVLLLIISGALLSTGCRKWWPESRILGNWKLIDAEERRFLDYDNITTGYESGLFIFYDNGNAEYKEGGLVMTGNWRIRTRNYDEDDTRNELTLRLYNFSANRVIDWEFDNVSFGVPGARKMRCFITRGRPNYRYLFERQ